MAPYDRIPACSIRLAVRCALNHNERLLFLSSSSSSSFILRLTTHPRFTASSCHREIRNLFTANHVRSAPRRRSLARRTQNKKKKKKKSRFTLALIPPSARGSADEQLAFAEEEPRRNPPPIRLAADGEGRRSPFAVGGAGARIRIQGFTSLRSTYF